MQKVLALALAALLAACGQKQPAQKHAENTDTVPAFPVPPAGERGGHDAPAMPPPVEGMRFFGGGSYPEPPGYLPIYPGAKVIGGMARGGRIRGGNLIFETSAQAADVIAFYEKSTAEAGFVQTVNSASGSTVSFAAAAGRRTVRITTEPIAGGSHVQIVWTGIE
jgi:hypothetical protein